MDNVVVATDGDARDAVPGLAAEDHECVGCGLAYERLSVTDALDALHLLAAEVREAVVAVPTDAHRVRPPGGGWSLTEYVFHLRDVYVTYTVRLHRARTEDQPVLEPMLNDLRARRFRHNDLDVHGPLEELAAVVSGFVEEAGRVRHDQWDRTVTRLPGERRTARWLVRQATHEGRHHLHDITRVGAEVRGSESPPDG